MSGRIAEIRRLLADLDRLAPMGHAAGLHVRFLVPVVSSNTYPQDWQDRYAQQVYGLRDPMIAWAFGGTGAARWSDVALPDPFGVIAEAAEFGLRHGVSVSVGPLTSRSVVACARADRPFTDEEMGEIERIAHRLHDISEPPSALTRAQVEALRRVAGGERHAAAAASLGISESALKARLVSARDKLMARTVTEAVQRAKEQRLI